MNRLQEELTYPANHGLKTPIMRALCPKTFQADEPGLARNEKSMVALSDLLLLSSARVCYNRS
jgi:hypothetical protein